MGDYSLEEMDSHQREFMDKDSDQPRFVVRKYEGQWYGVDNSVPPNARLDVPGQGFLLMINEDSGKVERRDSLMDIVNYMDDELGTVRVSEAPEEFRDRMEDLRE